MIYIVLIYQLVFQTVLLPGRVDNLAVNQIVVNSEEECPRSREDRRGEC